MRYPRMVEEALDSFFFGTCGGSAFFLLKGVYDSPKRYPKVTGLNVGLSVVRRMAPPVAGFAILVTGVLCTVDCTLECVRDKDDLLNKITAGAASAGLFTIRHALGPAPRSAVLCASFAGTFFANVK